CSPADDRRFLSEGTAMAQPGPLLTREAAAYQASASGPDPVKPGERAAIGRKSARENSQVPRRPGRYWPKDGMPVIGGRSHSVMAIICGVGSLLKVRSNCSFNPDCGLVLNSSSERSLATG